MEEHRYTSGLWGSRNAASGAVAAACWRDDNGGMAGRALSSILLLPPSTPPPPHVKEQQAGVSQTQGLGSAGVQLPDLRLVVALKAILSSGSTTPSVVSAMDVDEEEDDRATGTRRLPPLPTRDLEALNDDADRKTRCGRELARHGDLLTGLDLRPRLGRKGEGMGRGEARWRSERGAPRSYRRWWRRPWQEIGRAHV